MKFLAIPHVELRTASLDGVEPFYRDGLGFSAWRPAAGTLDLAFAPGAAPAITFIEDPAARPPPPRTAGLFHLALLAPDHARLAQALRRLETRGQEFQGFADHGVSEAVYLADPDGNGLELYADRPRAAWPLDHGRLAMFSRELDLKSLLATRPADPAAPPLAGGRIGHLHLQTVSLAASREFYAKTIGLEITQDGWPGACFLAADGYHHHLGLNTWARPERRAPEHATGLTGFTFAAADIAAPQTLADPDGHRVNLAPRVS